MCNVYLIVKEREEEYNQLMRTLKAKANKLIEEVIFMHMW